MENDIKLLNGDCLQLMQDIKDKSVDMILCDLPYGTTANPWDSIIPLEPLWAEYKRIIKPSGVIALFAQTPFDKVLGASNLQMLRYEWIWDKQSITGFLNAKAAPLKQHENILIFYDAPSDNYDTTNYFSELKDYFISERAATGRTAKEIAEILGNCMSSHYFTRGAQFAIPTAEDYAKLQTTGRFAVPYEVILEDYRTEQQICSAASGKVTYNPQMTRGAAYIARKSDRQSTNWGYVGAYQKENANRHPKDILSYKKDVGYHPTQKPVALLAYLIRTYTNAGEVVLDNTMGSGSTMVAAVTTGRKGIGIERDPKYFEIAQKRVRMAQVEERSTLFNSKDFE